MATANQVIYFNEPVERQLGFAAMVKTGDLLHLSGVLSIDEQLNVVAPGDMAGQIERVYDLLEATLAKVHADLSNVVNETIFVTDMQALAAAAATRTKRYAKCAPPASTAVQVSGLFLPGCLIELQAVAQFRG
jgi:enamine deaminase RidA (YjgF/YER057c/UK114 family)